MFTTDSYAEAAVTVRQGQSAPIFECDAASTSIFDDDDHFPEPTPPWWDAHLRAQ